MVLIPRPDRIGLALAAMTLLAQVPAASAAAIDAMVTDETGKPLAGAVVMVSPEPGTPTPPGAGNQIAAARIDQTNEAFVPDVVVIQTGGSVTFRNLDAIRHHVYSFASARRFEMVQAPGETSPPVVFDKPGPVAIGCNIHDHMTAHVLVTGAPWAVVTGASGHAMVSGLPVGRFSATVWHPRLRPRAEPAARTVALATEQTTLTVTLSVLPPRRVRGRDY